MLANAPSVTEWASFFTAQVGASASLTGLVIVAISINLPRIVAHPHLPGRALEGLAMLVGVLLVSSVALVPGQPIFALGCEIFAIGFFVWLLGTVTNVRARRSPVPGIKWAKALRALLGQLATLPIILAGGATLLWGTAGLYCLLPGIIFSLVAGVMNAWVLLVEIVR